MATSSPRWAGETATGESPPCEHVPCARLPRVPLLELDPDLAHAVPPGDRPTANRALSLTMLTLAPGPITLPPPGLPDTAFALIVLKGMLTQAVRLGSRSMAEPLLAHDVILPWLPTPIMPLGRPQLVALQDVELAALDQRFLWAASRWPGLMIGVERRMNDRRHRLATHGVICQLPRVEQRVLAILWHLAERTGTVGTTGVKLSLPLTHEELAQLIGARRPTVTLAVKLLRDAGHVDRLADGTWVLLRTLNDATELEDLGDGLPAAG